MFAGLSSPDIILITDVHGDHFNPETLDALNTENAGSTGRYRSAFYN